MKGQVWMVFRRPFPRLSCENLLVTIAQDCYRMRYFGATVYSRYFLWNHRSYWVLTQWEEMAAARLLRLSCLNVNDHSPGLIQVVSRTHCLGAFVLTLDPDTWDSNQTLRFPFILTIEKQKKPFYFWGISVRPLFQRTWTVFCMLIFNAFLSWFGRIQEKIIFPKGFMDSSSNISKK